MDLDLYLVTQEPIPFEGVFINQPTLKDIINIGTSNYDKLIIPYSLTWEVFNVPVEDQEKHNLFEDVIMRDDELISSLVLSLQLFFNSSDVDIDIKYIRIGKLIVDKTNFEELAKIILQINAREKIKVEKPPVFKNERQRDIYEKLQAGRARNAKKDGLQLYDILNCCEYGGRYHISIETIKNWTLWRIMNCYKTIVGIDNWESSFSIYLVSGDKSLIENKHWTQQIKISK